jgi:hypothetical protein
LTCKGEFIEGAYYDVYEATCGGESGEMTYDAIDSEGNEMTGNYGFDGGLDFGDLHAKKQI